MRLRKKPIKPNREKNFKFAYIGPDEISSYLSKTKIGDIDLKTFCKPFYDQALLRNDEKIWILSDFSECTILIEIDKYYDYSDMNYILKIPCIQSDEVYVNVITEYEKELESYNKWYEKNKDLVEEELLKRKEKKEAKKRDEILKYEKNLQKNIDKVEKDIARKKAKLEKMKKGKINTETGISF